MVSVFFWALPLPFFCGVFLLFVWLFIVLQPRGMCGIPIAPFEIPRWQQVKGRNGRGRERVPLSKQLLLIFMLFTILCGSLLCY